MSDAQCIVLDLDDTVYPEHEFVRSGFRHIEAWAADALGIEGLGETCWSLFRDGVRGHTFDRALELHGVPASPDSVRALVIEYRMHTPQIRVGPERLEVVEKLSENFRLCVLTGGNPDVQRSKYRVLGIDHLVESVVFCGDWGPEFDKPHERGWQAIEDLTGLSEGQLTYVADNPLKDWPATEHRGWSLIRVRMPDSLHAAVPTPAGAAEISDLVEIFSAGLPRS